MIVLWMIGVLGIVVLSVIQPATNAQADAIVRGKQIQAKCLAESGLVLALHPEVTRYDPLLKQREEEDARNGFEATSLGEAGRFGINSIVDERHQENLAQLLGVLGLEFEDARALADALADWIDEDDLRRLNGAERAQYTELEIDGAPANRLFGSVEEMRAVIGMDTLAEICPEWPEFFSTLNDTRIDVNSAPPEILEAVLRIADNKLETLLTTRAGPDRLPDTSDDIVIKDYPTMAKLIGGLTPDEQKRIEPLVIFESPARRVTSTGYFEGARCRLEVVAVPGVPARILSWEQM